LSADVAAKHTSPNAPTGQASCRTNRDVSPTSHVTVQPAPGAPDRDGGGDHGDDPRGVADGSEDREASEDRVVEVVLDGSHRRGARSEAGTRRTILQALDEAAAGKRHEPGQRGQTDVHREPRRGVVTQPLVHALVIGGVEEQQDGEDERRCHQERSAGEGAHDALPRRGRAVAGSAPATGSAPKNRSPKANKASGTNRLTVASEIEKTTPASPPGTSNSVKASIEACSIAAAQIV
jgi:hypothetical protein